jgi:hypothetical protein
MHIKLGTVAVMVVEVTSEPLITDSASTVEVRKSDPNPIRSDFGTKIYISDQIDKVVS